MFQQRSGKHESAARASTWNGADLATTSGLQLLLEQIRVLNPEHVWISPPDSAFSPLQRANQRNPQQVKELKHKREQAICLYHHVREVMRVCTQLGIHCTLELSEKSEAWRLPVMQEIQHDMGYHVSVTKGCSVGLSDAQGRLLQKGWRLVTSHRRLAECMHKRCMCPTSYVHAKAEGCDAKRTSRYTSEFARLVYQALQEELSFYGVLQECEGLSQLPESFGRGELCTCEDAFLEKHQLICGSCLLGRDVVPGALEEPDGAAAFQAHLTQQAHLTRIPEAPSELEARRICQQPNVDLKSLEEYLQEYAPRQGASRRQQVMNQQGSYFTYGTYSYGNQYGLTSRTQQNPELIRMINRVIQETFPENFVWTAFTLNLNSALPMHKDCHNHDGFLNCSVGLGSYSEGELWIETSEGCLKGVSEVKYKSNGEALMGVKVNIYHRPTMFHPKQWHQTCQWKGQRWVLTAYVSRGLEEFSETELRQLRKLGFKVPTRKAWSLEAECSPETASKHHVHTGPKEAQLATAYALGDPLQATQRERRREDERIRRQLHLLHCASGHGSLKHLIEALKRRRAPPRVLELAEAFKCPICEERSKPPPRAQATLEPLPPKYCTISADVGHWEHPHKKEAVQFMLIIDECSRYRVARVLSKGSKQHPSANTCIQYLQEGWSQYFGYPRALRVDPAGVFRGRQILDAYCDKHGVYLDIFPGEAHWKNGTCEQAIQGVKELMTRLCDFDPELTPEMALSEAITTFNHRDMVRGFTPAQQVIGRNADDTERFVEASQGLPPGLLVENPEGEFERTVKLRTEAEKYHAEWHARQRLTRARNSRARPCYNFQPGELVFFWRTQESGQGKRHPGTRQGRFLGPARILATESRTSETGEIRPGGAIWLVRGRSLIKCAPEQLRRATEREEMLEAIMSHQGQATPWTFTQVASSIGGNQYEDISEEKPDTSEWHRAQDATQEEQPTRLRMTRKRPPTTTRQTRDAIEDETMEGATEEDHEHRPPHPRREQAGRAQQLTGECWWATVKEHQWPEHEASFWSDHRAAVEVDVELPAGKKKLQYAARDFENYFAHQLKRRAVEVSERRLTPEELQAFQQAKQVEVKNFIAAEAFQALPPHLQPAREQAVGMRWILTWKIREDGSRKAKARAVLLGYQDPSYEHRSTTAPVMTRQSRQMILQLAAWKKWRLRKGDVSGAFLQGREYPGVLHCIPTKEICEAMSIPENSVTRLRRACYGLVDAPLEWYRTVDAFFQEIGLERTQSDACVWCYRNEGQLIGCISGHVDDFIFAGSDQHEGWRGILKKIQGRFQWGDWEEDRFTQCGVLIEQTQKGIELSQPNYLEGIAEIGISSSRRKDPKGLTTERERTMLRALLGGLSWHAQQIAPHLSADVSLLLSEVGCSTVDTVIRSNILLSHAKARANHKMLIHAYPSETDLGMVAWVDAASQNRVDGNSTQGIMVGIAPMELQSGAVCEVSLMSWHSSKIDRKCRSPGASEALAAINGEDCLYYARYQWSELLHGHVDLRRPDRTVSQTPGCLVTDSRNVYDKMHNEVLVIKGAEKRTSIELLGLKEAQRRTEVAIRWVHSEAQLANSLTKQGGKHELEMFYKMGFR